MNKFIRIGLAFSFFVGLSQPILAANTYPYPTAPRCGIEGCVADPWGFYKRQCTSYAAWKMNEAGINFYNAMSGPNGAGNWNNKFGNATNWNDQAREIGMAVDNTPRYGDIAVFEPGDNFASSLGHVSFVESVNSNGTINVSEYNFSPAHGYGTRSNIAGTREYIHLISGGPAGCGGTNVILQNQTIYNGSTFNCHAQNSITLKDGFSAQQGSNVYLYIN